jgi:hypothetical protein
LRFEHMLSCEFSIRVVLVLSHFRCPPAASIYNRSDGSRAWSNPALDRSIG